MLAVAILAAGKGTRMKSELPKVLHKVSGKSLLNRVINSCSKLSPEKIFVIVGHKSDEIKKSLDSNNHRRKIHFILQEPQNGTGHAIQVLSKELNEFKGTLLILNGDVPLITPETLKDFLDKNAEENPDVSLITTRKERPLGYGRVFTNGKLIEKIVEERDCDEKERLNTLINAGIYCFKWEKLSKIVHKLKNNNKQKEIYLTDAISLLKTAFSYEIKNYDELQGVNNRIQLAKCEQILQKRIQDFHMMNGVTIINPASCTISEDAEIGIDVTLEANTHIRGESKISDNCIIGPNTFIENSFVDKNCNIINSTIFNSLLMKDINVGPYSHLRPGTKISSNTKIGNFVEIKNSHIEESVKINHLSYIGDSEIGQSTNIGAGTITANFDGSEKHTTTIGANCNVGANSVFIAPVNIEEYVTTAAGSVINKNVGKESLAIARAKQTNIKNWKKKKRKSN